MQIEVFTIAVTDEIFFCHRFHLACLQSLVSSALRVQIAAELLFIEHLILVIEYHLFLLRLNGAFTDGLYLYVQHVCTKRSV